MSRSSARLATAFRGFTVVVAFDDTYTKVRIFTDEPGEGSVLVAEGEARRMKGDARDPEVGAALATGRAFEAMAKKEFSFADQRLNPKPVKPVDPPEWVKDLFNPANPAEGE